MVQTDGVLRVTLVQAGSLFSHQPNRVDNAWHEEQQAQDNVDGQIFCRPFLRNTASGGNSNEIIMSTTLLSMFVLRLLCLGI